MTFLTHSRENHATRPAPRNPLSEMLAVWHQRRALARLDDAALADIGLTRAQAEAEARRRPWDLPAGFGA